MAKSVAHGPANQCQRKSLISNDDAKRRLLPQMPLSIGIHLDKLVVPNTKPKRDCCYSVTAATELETFVLSNLLII